MPIVNLMRQDWDDRARRDPFHYIASWRKEWTLKEFLESGEHDYQKLVIPIVERCGMATTGDRMLELGCGAGRMTPNFAARYSRVVAVDVSDEMLQRAATLHSSLNNVSWLRVEGDNLSPVESGSQNFVFSYLVLQHMPTAEIAFKYIHEMLRVLRPGGAFLFQFNGSRSHNMNFRGRMAWGLVDALWSLRLRAFSRIVASALGFDPATAGRSWRGAALAHEHVAKAVREAGGDVREMSGENSPMAWCCGVKTC